MPTIIVTNPLRALQLENQRLRRENETLRQQLAAGGNRELGRETANAVQSARAVAPLPVQPTRIDGTVATRSLPAGPAPRPMVYVMAAESATPSAPRPSRAEAPAVSVALRPTLSEADALDDAATRFMLLELD